MLKTFLKFQFDKLQMDPSDVVYTKLCESMARNEAEEDFYRIFPLDIGQLSSSNSSTSTFPPQPDYIVLREAAQQISQGTTGLSCWQVCTVP
jgi:hypothetical protein